MALIIGVVRGKNAVRITHGGEELTVFITAPRRAHVGFAGPASFKLTRIEDSEGGTAMDADARAASAEARQGQDG